MSQGFSNAEPAVAEWNAPQNESGCGGTRRPRWREDLVQAERGVVRCLRGDSCYFVHFFGASLVLATAFVLGLSRLHWGVVLFCLLLVFAAEMFNHALRTIAEQLPDTSPMRRALGMGTAGVLATIAASAILLACIFWDRLSTLLGP